MIKRLFAFFIFLWTFSSLITGHAASLQLNKIGVLDTMGKSYSEWWYTGINPMLSGSYLPSEEIEIILNGGSNKITSTSSGEWSFQTQLPEGDNTVTIKAGSEVYTFTLHLGQNIPENVLMSGDAGAGSTGSGLTASNPVPETGFQQIIGLSFGLGILLLASYLYIWGSPNNKYIITKRSLIE